MTYELSSEIRTLRSAAYALIVVYLVWLFLGFADAETFFPGVAHLEDIPLPGAVKVYLFGTPFHLFQAFVANVLLRSKTPLRIRIAFGFAVLNVTLLIVQLVLGLIYT